MKNIKISKKDAAKFLNSLTKKRLSERILGNA